MRRFIRAADPHLDTSFQAMLPAVPDVAEARWDASLEAFDRMVQLAIDRDVAFPVIAGDVYDGADAMVDVVHDATAPTSTAVFNGSAPGTDGRLATQWRECRRAALDRLG